MSENILKDFPWITESFLLDALKKLESNAESIAIKSFDVKNAVADGENYGSKILRITVKYTLNDTRVQKSTDFVLKTKVVNQELDELTKKYDVFLREVEVYRRILPEVYSLLRSIGDPTKLGPLCYKCDNDKAYLLFEDLKLTNYKNVEKASGLNFEEMKIALSKLARWHAATAYLGVSKPDTLKDHILPFIRADLPLVEEMRTRIILSLADVMENWPNYERIREKLLSVKDKVLKRICEDYVYKEDDFNVILHGDVWMNNIMYKFDEEGHPEDVLFIDMTNGCWGSPGKDVSYMFFSSSSKQELKDCEWDRLLQHYHDQLKSTLVKLNYPRKIPSLTDIHISFLNAGISNVIICALVIGIRYLKESDVKGILTLLSDGEEGVQSRYQMFANPDCKDCLQFLLDYADRKGFLDI